jgi:SPP1 family predicted phage head-tail adaptor
MKRVGIVYLITEQPEARGVLDAVTETRRKTYCEEKSLSMNETYQARASGHAPTIRLKLPQNFEYKGETLCEYKGERYAILRDYTDEKVYGAELTLERVRGNAAPGSEGSGAPVGQSPEGDSDPNESSETSGANANSGADATIEDAGQGGDDP